MTGRHVFMLGAMTVSMLACSGGEPAAPAGSSSGSSGSSGSNSGSSGSTTTDAGATVGVPASCPGGDEGGVVPKTAAELQTWLDKRAYKCWAHESAKHRSSGPHGGDVQTYLNAKMDTSMKGSAEHPEGAVAVKELYGSSNEVKGYAVAVKTQASSANGQGYYWYELLPGGGTIEGQGKKLCVDCHAAGKDYVLIPYPLR